MSLGPKYYHGWVVRCLLLLFMWQIGNAVVAQPGSETEVVFLSGTDNTHTATWDFYCTGGRKSGYWTTIEVPSCWEQQGFGNYDYGRDYRTYGKKFRFSDEQGIYRLDFDVPAEWAGKEITIVFDGSMTDTEVFINGESAGPKHQGGFYRFTYRITDLLQFGAGNGLEVRVAKMSSDHSVNRAERFADYWIFGGIFRPVYLEVRPPEHIVRTAIAANAEGAFLADIYLDHIRSDAYLYLEISDRDGNVVAMRKVAVDRGDTLQRVECQVVQPVTWNAERPYLYTASVLLTRADEDLHRVQEKFGFRSVEIRRGDGVYVNGTKVKFKGINRHCFWPETGRTLSRKIDSMDIVLMKAMNLNAVRCSHYPPDRSFLELCDATGLYVIDELAGWQNAYDTAVGVKLVREMVVRDVNHPSVVLWSNGNEGGTNPALDDDFQLYDPSRRPVIHCHHRPGNDFNGIETNHYEKYYSTKDILDDSLIYIPTEFLHAQDDGGGAAGLHDFWELMWAAPRSGGGFLWALLDEGLVRTDLNNYIDVDRVNAPDGVLGPHREKEGSFNALKEIFSPIVIRQEQFPDDFTGVITVENRYHFTSLQACTFKAQFVSFRDPGDRLAGHLAGKEIPVPSPAVAAGAAGSLRIPLPADWKSYDQLRLLAFGPDGAEVMSWGWATGRQRLVGDWAAVSPTDTALAQFAEDDSTLILRARDIGIVLSKETGMLADVSYTQGLDPSLSHGPVSVNGNSTLIRYQHATEPDGEVVKCDYEGVLKSVEWKMLHSGWIKLDYTFALDGEYQFTGVSFNYPESNIIGVKWLGKGPYRVWKNRLQGVITDVWESMYNITHTGSAPWAYPEFKGYFSEVAWMEFNTVEGKFLVGSPDPGLFVRLFDFHGLSAPDPQPPLPIGDISFLEGIPPIGTKLATGIDMKTGGLGPASELNAVNGTVRRTLYFYFGPVPEDNFAD